MPEMISPHAHDSESRRRFLGRAGAGLGLVALGIRLRQTRGSLIQRSRPLSEAANFLRIEGDQSTDVALLSNNLRWVGKFAEKADGFNRSVAMEGNLLPAPGKIDPLL